jgi:two-component system, sensor histidine kinase and response regulator
MDKMFPSVRILIAEDNLINQKVALGQLKELGYSAQAVPNGRDLLKFLENEHVDIILMDWQMPEMDGLEATREIRRREGVGRHTPIIALTANALDGDRQRCLAAGMDDYLSKPVKLDELRQKLELWTKRNHSRGSVIDQAQIASLREIQQPGEPDLLTELIDLFLNEAASDLKALRKALIEDDAAEVKRLTHRLKGSSANMGATQLAAIAGELESKDPTKETSALMAQIENEFELVWHALKAEQKVEE